MIDLKLQCKCLWYRWLVFWWAFVHGLDRNFALGWCGYLRRLLYRSSFPKGSRLDKKFLLPRHGRPSSAFLHLRIWWGFLSRSWRDGNSRFPDTHCSWKLRLYPAKYRWNSKETLLYTREPRQLLEPLRHLSKIYSLTWYGAQSPSANLSMRTYPLYTHAILKSVCRRPNIDKFQKYRYFQFHYPFTTIGTSLNSTSDIWNFAEDHTSSIH